jgi:hypothetical protein
MAGFTASNGPARPYSTHQLGGNTPRSAEFATGTTGDPGSAVTMTTRASTGLTEDSLQFNAMVPGGVKPASVLQPLRPSMNGMSAADYRRVLPGGYTLPTANGQSTSSYEASLPLRLSGLNAE